MKELISRVKELSIEDYTQIIKYGKKVARWAKDNACFDVKIAVLGSASIQFVVSALRTMLLKHDVRADIYEGEYDGLNMDILNEESQFYAFAPQIIFLLPDYRDIQSFPALLSSEVDVDNWVRRQIDVYVGYWEMIRRQLPSCQIFQSNFAIPIERELGNLEASVIFSKKAAFEMLNLELMRKRTTGVNILDVDYMASYYGKVNWFEPTAWFLHKAGFSMKYIGVIADAMAKQVLIALGRTRKCLVLDLDNTLWGGVVGDDGCDGINLNPNDAIGEAYLHFQKYILRLKERGVILAVCSKNELEIAKEPFLHNPNMLIKWSDIAVFVANWDDKASNLKRIAEELNIGLDAMVFFDDNPAEREIVKMYLPEVCVINVPEDPAYFVSCLNEENPFEWLQLTNEDIKRVDTYEQNRNRNELLSQYNNYNEYLEALLMCGNVQRIEERDSERFAQLINKSNQFNMRTIRYSEGEISGLIHVESTACLKIELQDKFSNYGIISCIILKKKEQVCFIDTWVMSCRVLKRGVEDVAFKNILNVARQWGCSEIIGEYIPTRKNKMVENLYSDIGFIKVEVSDMADAEKVTYQYDVSKDYHKDIFIKLGKEV